MKQITYKLLKIQQSNPLWKCKTLMLWSQLYHSWTLTICGFNWIWFGWHGELLMIYMSVSNDHEAIGNCMQMWVLCTYYSLPQQQQISFSLVKKKKHLSIIQTVIILRLQNNPEISGCISWTIVAHSAGRKALSD